jgi:hypothetical protein
VPDRALPCGGVRHEVPVVIFGGFLQTERR